jgi:hypothetical protein
MQFINVHARFVSNPKREHGDAVQWIGRYLKFTRDKGTIYRPIVGKDSGFCGDWNSIEAKTDKDTARSRHGYIIYYGNHSYKTRLHYQQQKVNIQV